MISRRRGRDHAGDPGTSRREPAESEEGDSDEAATAAEVWYTRLESRRRGRGSCRLGGWQERARGRKVDSTQNSRASDERLWVCFWESRWHRDEQHSQSEDAFGRTKPTKWADGVTERDFEPACRCQNVGRFWGARTAEAERWR
jgi:hypothetical protein